MNTENETKIENETKKHGPRKVFFVAAAIKEGTLIQERILVSETLKDADEKLEIEDISNSFEELHGIQPQNIQGPFYERKGIAQSKTNISHSLDVAIVGKTFFAERLVKNTRWKVLCNETTDPSRAFITQYLETVNGPSKRGPRPKLGFCNRSELSSIKENRDNVIPPTSS